MSSQGPVAARLAALSLVSQRCVHTLSVSVLTILVACVPGAPAVRAAAVCCWNCPGAGRRSRGDAERHSARIRHDVRTHWPSAAGRVTGTRAAATCGGGRRVPCRGHCHSPPTRHRRPAPQKTSQRPRIRRVHMRASCAATKHHRIATAQPRNWPLPFSPASTPLPFALTRPAPHTRSLVDFFRHLPPFLADPACETALTQRYGVCVTERLQVRFNPVNPLCSTHRLPH